MRRFLCILLVCLLTASVACAALTPLQQAATAIFDEVQARMPGKVVNAQDIDESGSWISVASRFDEEAFTRWLGLIYDMDAGTFLTWDNLFTDGEAAAARMAEIAEATTYANAYSEHNAISPVPRDSFAYADGQLAVYYPPEQLSHFSGRAGAYTFYAYELEGLVREGLPFTRGDVSLARDYLTTALEVGFLPGSLAYWAVGMPMAEAAEVLGLVDVPDATREYTRWQFEAPEMRGVSLLSALGDEQTESATIAGIHAERIDFSGLCTGVSTLDECIQALGEPDDRAVAYFSDAYSLISTGTTLYWTGANTLALHFDADGGVETLHSVTLLLGESTF